MTTWDATLPQAFLDGTYSRGTADNRLRSANDSGPAKLRRRSSRMPYPVAGDMLFTEAQLVTLAGFVETTTQGGTLPFDFPDPEGGSALEVRFLSMPAVTHRTAEHYTVTLELEALP